MCYIADFYLCVIIHALCGFCSFVGMGVDMDGGWGCVRPSNRITEANLYKAQKDLEESAASATEAYKLAKVIQSPKDEMEVKKIFSELQKLDATNPYVCNLGMMLSMY
jgi:hypothetical protein